MLLAKIMTDGINEFREYLSARVDDLLIRGAYYGEPCYDVYFTYKGCKYRYIVSIFRVGKKAAKEALRRCEDEKSNTTIEMEFYLRDITEQAKP